MIKTFKAQSKQWKDFRNTRLTGTELGAIVGVGGSIDAVIKKKYEESVFFSNPHVVFGHALEPAAINLFSHYSGMSASPAALDGEVKMVTIDETCLASSLDALVDLTIPLECKTTSVEKLAAWEDFTEPKYVVQTYLEMMGMGTDISYICAIAAIHNGIITKIYSVKRNDRLEEIILEEAERFNREVFINGARTMPSATKRLGKEVTEILKSITKLEVEQTLQK